jgi:protein gp37
MSNTSIEWTSKVWNVTRGCARVSAGCGTGVAGGCYAERQAHRFSGPGMPYEGLTKMGKHGPQWTGRCIFVPEKLDEPLHWKKPARIFVNSMSDLFHDDITNEQISTVFSVMADCPQHTFQILTKRPARMLEALEWIEEHSGGHHGNWPLQNVHLGVSCENQETANERIPILLKCPAGVRFVSAEPLLGAIAFGEKHLGQGSDCPECGWGVLVDEEGCCATCGEYSMWYGLDWVIVGGESGPRRRDCEVEWIHSIVEQCEGVGVPCFVKQDSGARSGGQGRLSDELWSIKQFPVTGETP